MKPLAICFRVEIAKLRRTLALAVTLLTPVIVILMQAVNYTRHADFYMNAGGVYPWKFFGETTLVYWSVLFLPLYITLISALLAQLEHAHHNWKLLCTLPVPRRSIYNAKLLLMGLLVLICYVLLLALMFLLGFILQAFDPAYGFDSLIPWGAILRMAGLSFVASWFMIAFHTWVSVRWPTFVVAVGVGIAATLLGILGFGDALSSYYPWTIPGMFATNLAQKGITSWISIGIGCLGALPVALLGGIDTSGRDVI